MIDDPFLLVEMIRSRGLNLWLTNFSINTWNRIEFVRTRNRLKIFETTVTQNLLFELARFSEFLRMPIKMFESVSENTNGSDLEILVQVKGGYILFPCQAKIIYPQDRYQQIDHVVGGRQQIDLLIEYAKSKRGVPIYLFYNYCSNQEWHQEIQGQISFDIRLYGCSLSNANLIKSKFCTSDKSDKKYLKWQIPNFKDLHPKYAHPFCLIGESDNRFLNVPDLVKKITGAELDEQVKTYSVEEVLEDPLWQELVFAPRIGRLEEDLSNRERYIQFREDSFNPKFRIVFSDEMGTKISVVY